MTSYNPTKPWEGYAKTTVRRSVIDVLRRKENRNQAIEEAAAIPYDDPEPIDRLDEDESAAINRAFDALPEHNKEVVIAYLLINDDWTMKRVAELTGIPLENCQYLYRKSREMMRSSFGDYEYE